MCERCREPEYDPEDDGSFGSLLIGALKEMQDKGELPLGHQDLTKLKEDAERQEALDKLTPRERELLGVK
jgi:hypothetical protein